MLHRLKPVIPVPPNRSKSQPPTTPPTTPRMMSRKKPSPCRFTILLAMKPAISPRTIQPMIDMSPPHRVVLCTDAKVAQSKVLERVGDEPGTCSNPGPPFPQQARNAELACHRVSSECGVKLR